MRRNCEIDLPRRFLELYGPKIEAWIETAIPGMTYSILIAGKATPPALSSPFVTSSTFERNVATLRAVELSSSSGPCILIEPADKASRRLIEDEEKRITPPSPLRGLPSGTPITATYGGYAL
jgi:hypothetical protein